MSVERSTATKAAAAMGETAAAAMTPTWVQPQSALWVRANMAPPAASDNVTAPRMSKRTRGRSDDVSSRINMATITGTMASTAWTANTARHPTASTSTPPTTSPIDGAPAPTNDHQPSALTRSSGGKARMISAMAVGWVAAPMTWVTVRRAISANALQARAVRPAVRVARAKPMRNTRRCPYRSPILPRMGSATAEASMGAATTQVIRASLTPKSSAMTPRETVRMVTGKLVANMPTRAVISTQRR